MRKDRITIGRRSTNMAGKKKGATTPAPESEKKTAKKAVPGTSRAAIEEANSKKASSKKSAPTNAAALPVSAKPAGTRPRLPNVTSDVIKALQGGKILPFGELVRSAGGNEKAVRKAVNGLRGDGKLIVRGSTRSATYSLVA
jgi:hypothetical protein